MKISNYKKLNSIINSFSNKKVLVLGDIMVDRFIWGKVSRISPEAPVPVVKVEKETLHLGGAGNVVNNLVALGSSCSIVGVIGKDLYGRFLKENLKSRGVKPQTLYEDSGSTTIQKTRIIAGSQQLVRVDWEKTRGSSKKLINNIIDKFKSEIHSVDAVIISDYGKGVINKDVLSVILPLCRKKQIPIMVDPKIEHFQMYKHVTCITPNLKEALEGMFFRSVSNKKDLEQLGRLIVKKLKAKSVLITRGEHGMSLFDSGNRVSHLPTVAKEVFDVTGAGDTVISVFTLAFVSGATLTESAYLSNIAGGIVVGKIGTATATQKELIDWMN
ncbi:MAG: D-glycero-beta-D-manno-heptose-7-phosphate kinase [bacterium]